MPEAALIVSQDLLFAVKIQAAAGPLGLRLLQESDAASIERVLSEHAVRIVFFDLNCTSLTPTELIDLLPPEPQPVTVAFGPHVNTVLLDEARNAGFDYVLPRSRFAGELPSLLSEALRDS